MSKLLLRHDSRDFVHANAFGQAVDIPDEINFDTILPDNVQPLGDVKCVCYSICDEAEDEFNKEFDINDLWNRIPHNQFGSDPRDALNETINNGLLPIGQKDRLKDYKSFYRADMGQRDAFDNVRISATIAQTSVIVGLYWCMEWLNVPAFGVMPEGKTISNGHAFVIEGWRMVNGEPMFIVEAWIGRKLYMPRNVFNKAMYGYGTQTWILATEEVNSKRQKTILETIKDACINVIILLKELLVVKKVDNHLPPKPAEVYNEVKEAIKINMIEKWANGIEKREGAEKFLNNPGNFKYSPFTIQYGAVKGKKAFGSIRTAEDDVVKHFGSTDYGNFAQFPTYEAGRKCLIDFLTLGCKDELKSYHTPPKDHPNVNPRTIKGFTLVYTNFPTPKYDYSDNLIKELGVSADTLISSFLS